VAKTIDSILASVSKERIRKAGTLKIREPEWEDDGWLVAFAEEGSRDFDVRIQLAGGRNLKAHTCDCTETGPMCLHTIALLLHAAGAGTGKKEKAPRTRKISPLEAAMGNAGPEELKAWLLEELPGNKEFLYRFMNRFSGEVRPATPESVQEEVRNVVASLVKKKKKLEQSEVRRILDIWEKTQKPIVDGFMANVQDPAGYALFLAIQLSIGEATRPWVVKTGRVESYLNRLRENALKAIQALPLPVNRQAALSPWLQDLNRPGFSLVYTYFSLLASALPGFDEQTREQLLESLMQRFLKIREEDPYRFGPLERELLEAVGKQKSFGRYASFFGYQFQSTAYNLRLVSLLMEEEKYRDAAHICRMALDRETSLEQIHAYFPLLKEIYKRLGDGGNLLLLARETLPLTFSLEDYRLVAESLTDPEERKKFRNQILARARSSYSLAGHRFCLNMMAEEKNYSRLLEFMGAKTPPSDIAAYIPGLVREFPSVFLGRLLDWDSERARTRMHSDEVPEDTGLVVEGLLAAYSHAQIEESLSVHNQKQLKLGRWPGPVFGPIFKGLSEAVKPA
jgi:hypothetical protein